MGLLFSSEKPLREVLRENKRMIMRAIRELDRERSALEREEKRLTIDIKNMARKQQMNAVKIMAKDLVRTRNYITRFIEMRSHLQSCALKLQTVTSHHAMAEALKNTTKAMVKMNKAINVPFINKMMAEFEKENMKTEMMQEVMGEMLDDAMEQEGDAEETDKIVAQVLDEIGISFGNEIPTVVGTGLGNNSATQVNTGTKTPALAAANSDSAVEDLQRRFNNLDK